MISRPAAVAVLHLLGALLIAGAAAAQTGDRPDWAGRWEGTLLNLPLRPGAAAVTVTAEIGDWPSADKPCTTWRRSYRSTQHPPMTKDYQLCRGTAEGEWVVDEGNGVRLSGRLLADVLVTPFKYGKLLLLTTTRLRGDVLEEEIFTVDDQPAIEGPLPLQARGIQRLSFRRVAR